MTYKVVIDGWEAGVYLNRLLELEGHPTPMESLIRVADLIAEAGGFEDLATIVCVDEDTGVSQWELTIK